MVSASALATGETDWNKKQQKLESGSGQMHLFLALFLFYISSEEEIEGTRRDQAFSNDVEQSSKLVNIFQILSSFSW
jgi:hypothetical protein